MVIAVLFAVALYTNSASAAMQPRIIGGQPALQGSWPYAALVILQAPDETALCSGSVVSSDLILTAGHCAFDPDTGTTWPASDYTVITGSVDPYTVAGQESGVRQVLLDGLYKRLTSTGVSDWDAALLQLSAPTTEPPVALATASADASLYNGGTPAAVAGWGLTEGEDQNSLPENLQYADTEVESESACSAVEMQSANPFDSADQICATYPPLYATGTCQGDSGGPLVADAAGSVVQIGLTSFGTSDCDTTQPSFYTSVAAIQPWVAAEMAALSQPGGATAAPPTATTSLATDLTDSSAQLNGTVVPDSGATSYYFQWGLTTAYSSQTPVQTTDTTVLATAAIAGLSARSTIHYRLVASSQTGTSYGSDETLETSSSPSPPRPPARLASRGIYRGITAQHFLVSVNLAANERDVDGLSFGVYMRCTRHLGLVRYELRPDGNKLWPKRLKDRFDLAYSFRDSDHWRYVVRAVFTTGGAVSGTLNVAGVSSSYGSCRSGTVHFSAIV